MVQYCLVRFDGDTNELTTFDVVKLTRVVSDEEDGPCEGSPVRVRWRDHRGRDKGLFQATLIARSEDHPQLVGQMDKAIAKHNRQATVDPKKVHPPSRRRPSQGPGDRSTARAFAHALARRGSSARVEDSAVDDGIHQEQERAIGLRA
ncbi:hypothetical protein MTO96_035359 [Rhipicephalus appendiculatus]